MVRVCFVCNWPRFYPWHPIKSPQVWLRVKGFHAMISGVLSWGNFSLNQHWESFSADYWIFPGFGPLGNPLERGELEKEPRSWWVEPPTPEAWETTKRTGWEESLRPSEFSYKEEGNVRQPMSLSVTPQWTSLERNVLLQRKKHPALFHLSQLGANL